MMYLYFDGHKKICIRPRESINIIVRPKHFRGCIGNIYIQRKDIGVGRGFYKWQFFPYKCTENVLIKVVQKTPKYNVINKCSQTK